MKQVTVEKAEGGYIVRDEFSEEEDVQVFTDLESLLKALAKRFEGRDAHIDLGNIPY